MNRFLFSFLLYSAVFSLVYSIPTQQTENENEGRREMFFFRDADENHPYNRSKRQIENLVSSLVSGGSAGAAASGGNGGDAGGAAGGSPITSLIPGFSEYGPALMALVNNFLGFVKCCKPVVIPNVIAKLVMKCSDDLTTKFFADSGFINRTENEKKNTLFLKSPSLSGFFEAEFLGPDGLPIPEKMEPAMLKIMVNQNQEKQVGQDKPLNQTAMLSTAFKKCAILYKEELKNVTDAKRILTDSDKCWGSAAFIECMYRQIILVCPDDRLEAGTQCIQKLGDFFWSEMPKQVGRFFSVVKSMVDIL